jgi:hypothetical protein
MFRAGHLNAHRDILVVGLMHGNKTAGRAFPQDLLLTVPAATAHNPWDVPGRLALGAVVSVLGWWLLHHSLTALTAWHHGNPDCVRGSPSATARSMARSRPMT